MRERFNCACSLRKKINVGKVVQAGSDAAKAITLSDADIAAMSKEYMQWMDTHNPLTAADSEYGKRLEKLTGHIKEVDGLKVNFGVYEVVDVNAFACGDGSVRICAGLMDIMTDDEVMAVVGHEIGHVIHTDSKDAMKSAYLRSAVKNAAGAASSTVSKLTDSELGAMAEALAGANQFRLIGYQPVSGPHQDRICNKSSQNPTPYIPFQKRTTNKSPARSHQFHRMYQETFRVDSQPDCIINQRKRDKCQHHGQCQQNKTDITDIFIYRVNQVFLIKHILYIGISFNQFLYFRNTVGVRIVRMQFNFY